MNYKKIVWIGALAAAACLAVKPFVRKSKEFTFAQVASDRSFEPLFETRPLSEEEKAEVSQALDQEYSYFGCGGQAYIFFSSDGKYALKLFKQHHFRKPTYLNYIPFIGSYRDRKYMKRRKRLELDYCSYKMGFEELLEETAILYPHLNKTSHLNKTLVAVDKLGIRHEIDLDNTDFLLQRRAQLVTHDIEKKMADGDILGAKKTIREVLGLVVTRCKKGFRDRDPNVFTNCGILEGKAIKIDVGRFTKDPKMARPLYFKPELYGIVRPFRVWINHRFPELVPCFDEELGRIISHD